MALTGVLATAAFVFASDDGTFEQRICRLAELGNSNVR